MTSLTAVRLRIAAADIRVDSGHQISSKALIDEDGRAELHFDDPFDGRAGGYSDTHSIWVAPEFHRTTSVVTRGHERKRK